MPLKPYDLNESNLFENLAEVNLVDSIPSDLNDVLADAGLAKKSVKDVKLKEARDIFNKNGATIEMAAQQVSTVMEQGKANERLKAVELTMKVHGILQEMDEKQIPQITVNVIGSENKTLINLVLPTV